MFGNKYITILILALRIIGPCIIQYLNATNAPVIKGMDPGKKVVLTGLLEALNTKDWETKKRIEAAEIEVTKIHGGVK